MKDMRKTNRCGKEAPLTLPLSPRGEGTPELASSLDGEAAACSLSQPHPIAEAVIRSGMLAKASLRGEGWGEGVFARSA
jgi:hypothetical protein